MVVFRFRRNKLHSNRWRSRYNIFHDSTSYSGTLAVNIFPDYVLSLENIWYRKGNDSQVQGKDRQYQKRL